MRYNQLLLTNPGNYLSLWVPGKSSNVSHGKRKSAALHQAAELTQVKWLPFLAVRWWKLWLDSAT
jgi:hypothetical protein